MITALEPSLDIRGSIPLLLFGPIRPYANKIKIEFVLNLGDADVADFEILSISSK